MVAVKANLQEKNGPTSERLKRTHACIVSEDPVVVVVHGSNGGGVVVLFATHVILFGGF